MFRAQVLRNLSVAVVVFSTLAGTAQAAPLRRHPINGRYFQDQTTGKAIALHGGSVWNDFFDTTFDWQQYLVWAKARNQNSLLLWADGLGHTGYDPNTDTWTAPWWGPTERWPWALVNVGGAPKLDLNQPNQAYYEALHERVAQAKAMGIHITVKLFEGSTDIWGGVNDRDPFDPANNINGVDLTGWRGSTNHASTQDDRAGLQFGETPMDQLRWDYNTKHIARILDALKDFDNVQYAIFNEGDGTVNWESAWQFMQFIKDYEATLPNGPHPVSTECGYAMWNRDARNAPLADAWSPDGKDGDFYDTAGGPVAAKAEDPVTRVDTDHIGIGNIANKVSYRAKLFLRGHGDIQQLEHVTTPGPSMPGTTGFLMQSDGREPRRIVQAWMGYFLNHAVDLAKMIPQPSVAAGPTDTGFCLFSAGQEYFIYHNTANQIHVELPPGPYTVTWYSLGQLAETPFNPNTPNTGPPSAATQTITSPGGLITLTPPGNIVYTLAPQTQLWVAPELLSDDVFVHVRRTAQFPTAVLTTTSPLNGPAPLTITVNGLSSSDPNGTIASYRWDFGDGQLQIGAIAQHVYVRPGHYPLTLTVTDNEGASHSVSRWVDVDAPAPAAITTATLPVTADAWIDADAPTVNHGSDTALQLKFLNFTQETLQFAAHEKRRMLVRFDLASVMPPMAQAEILKATLRINSVNYAGRMQVDFAPVTTPWSESTVTHSQASTGMAWTTPGGNHDILKATSGPLTGDGPMDYDITTIVKTWHSGAQPNHGLLVIARSGNNLTGQFQSRETSAGGPQLIVEYYVPPTPPALPTGVANLGGGTGSSLQLTALGSMSVGGMITLQVTGATSGQMVWLGVSLYLGSTPTTPGLALNLTPGLALIYTATADAQGVATFTFISPNVVGQTYYGQAAVASPTFTLTFSNALQGTVQP